MSCSKREREAKGTRKDAKRSSRIILGGSCLALRVVDGAGEPHSAVATEPRAIQALNVVESDLLAREDPESGRAPWPRHRRSSRPRRPSQTCRANVRVHVSRLQPRSARRGRTLGARGHSGARLQTLPGSRRLVGPHR